MHNTDVVDLNFLIAYNVLHLQACVYYSIACVIQCVNIGPPAVTVSLSANKLFYTFKIDSNT